MAVMGILAGPVSVVAKSALVTVPHDPATDIVYALVGLSVVAIWYGNRKSQGPGKGGEPGEGEGPDVEGKKR